MIHKPCLWKKSLFVMTLAFILTIIFLSAPIVNSVNAADKEGPDYVCRHVSGSGTIGQVKCCSTISTNPNCTICDNTTPPSNCQPATVGKFDPGNVLHSNNGGVLSQNDGSSGSTGIGSSINQQGGTFNADQRSNNPSDSENKVDSNKIIEGGSFNQ